MCGIFLILTVLLIYKVRKSEQIHSIMFWSFFVTFNCLVRSGIYLGMEIDSGSIFSIDIILDIIENDSFLSFYLKLGLKLTL